MAIPLLRTGSNLIEVCCYLDFDIQYCSRMGALKINELNMHEISYGTNVLLMLFNRNHWHNIYVRYNNSNLAIVQFRKFRHSILFLFSNRQKKELDRPTKIRIANIFREPKKMNETISYNQEKWWVTIYITLL